MPSENELMKLYDSSRDTVWKALNLLASSGYIQKEKRKGSLVLDVGLIFFPVSGLTSFKELERSAHRYHSKTIGFSINGASLKPLKIQVVECHKKNNLNSRMRRNEKWQSNMTKNLRNR